MKKILANILIFTCMTAVISGVFAPQEVSAQELWKDSLTAQFVNLGLDTVTSVLGYIGGYILEISARILALSGILLNSAMNVTLNLSSIINDNSAIDTVWIVMRDFASIFFIFLLLYSSISIIIGSESAVNTKKLIARIVLFGILINFSLFFTKVVIDASNVVALGFYNAIAPSNDTSRTNYGGGFMATDGGISNVFMQALGVVTLYDAKGAIKVNQDFARKNVSVAYIGSAIMIVAAGSFFAISIMLLVRIVVLILLLATSPIYFIAQVLPKTQEYASKWLNTLVGQSLFPSIYLAMVYLSLKIMTTFKDLQGTQSNGSSTFSDLIINGNNVGVLFNYILVIILLNAAVVTAAKYMGKAGEYSNNMVDKMKKFGSTSVRGAGRNTFGRAASRVSNSEWLKDKASRYGAGAMVLKGVRGVAGSYDEKLKGQIEERTKFAKSLGYNQDKVLDEERDIAVLHEQIAAQNHILNTSNSSSAKASAKQAKDILEKQVKAKKDAINNIKNDRQISYAQRQDPRQVDPKTGQAPISLWDRMKKKGYVARKEKAAGAEIRVGVYEKELENLEKDLNEIKPDIKDLEKKQRTTGQLAPLEQVELDKLYTKKSNTEKQIRDQKLKINTYKNIE